MIFLCVHIGNTTKVTKFHSILMKKRKETFQNVTVFNHFRLKAKLLIFVLFRMFRNFIISSVYYFNPHIWTVVKLIGS